MCGLGRPSLQDNLYWLKLRDALDWKSATGAVFLADFDFYIFYAQLRTIFGLEDDNNLTNCSPADAMQTG